MTVLSAEFMLSMGLRQHGINLYNKAWAYRNERKPRARHAIKEFALADEIWCNKTFRDWFALAYEEAYE